ncbi:VIT and VWA domain-containing protein [bacterium]|nr:VIT and VWA domain-containing protein [bacterium]
MKRIIPILIAGILLAAQALAAGTLTPVGADYAPIQIMDHHLDVVINNGFARTEVTQTFSNPNDKALEAIYSFPLPKSASLSEVTITIGETKMDGEVVEAQKAKQIYEEERDQGRDAGLTTKNEYKTFEFRVARIQPHAEIKIRFLYYQPLPIDTGVGRYVYPLQEGGVDEQALAFWTTNDKISSGTLSVDLELKSAWPIDKARVPGLDQDTSITRIDDGHYKVHFEKAGAALNRDFVFYYMLKPNLPGRVELLTFRDKADANGTFMMVLTPGLDLKPLTNGSDYLFVLDISGSMDSKLATLARGVNQALGKLSARDRFMIVTFNDRAKQLTSGWTVASPENVKAAADQVSQIKSGGSTNMYEGVELGLKSLDADRATCFILVTDGVTNTGVLEPAAFHKLMKAYDVRFFGFLLGNSGNWPLMRTLCDASGGYLKEVSNDDDIIGQILLAKEKIVNECLHDASLSIDGVKVSGTTDLFINKIYYGQQLVFFGRYEGAGKARLTLKARKTGQDLTYSTEVDFPAANPDNPELERLWALNQIEQVQLAQDIGKMNADEARGAIVNLGLQYQLVTDHTSMLILSDQKFQEKGINRLNQQMIARERDARIRQAQGGGQIVQADKSQPMFNMPAPSLGHGGGVLDPLTVAFMLSASAAALATRRRRNRREDR